MPLVSVLKKEGLGATRGNAQAKAGNTIISEIILATRLGGGGADGEVREWGLGHRQCSLFARIK